MSRADGPPAEQYVIRGGQLGYERLTVLARSWQPTTSALFDRVQLGPGMRCLDLGCGSGKLLARLLRQRGIDEIVGVEVSSFELARAAKYFARLPEAAKRRLKLWHGSLTYRDARLRGFDAAALVEVVEHLEPDRLVHLERALFGDARPGLIVATTPNRDYNVLFSKLEPSRLRHPDHRFEWSRAEFQSWADAVAARNGYAVRFESVGDEHAELGAPTQLAVFTR